MITLDLPAKIQIGKKLITINSQALYSGLHYQVRRKLMEELKNCISFQLPRGIKLSPHLLTYEFRIKKKRVDLDNLSYVYIKAINDAMISNSIIPDDDISIINQLVIKCIVDNSVKQDRVLITVYDAYDND